jgi:hypothetical protein
MAHTMKDSTERGADQVRLLPNTRLKLAAPVLYNDGVNADLRCCPITFVKPTARRRSLSAIR